MDASQFKNRPLDKSRKEIRLIRILPSEGAEIACSIRHADLQFPPRYCALSYAWGPCLPTFNIQCDGQLHQVRANLFHFLRRMKKENYTGEIWIDQISIDQEDIEEKNHQVSMMADIYEHAETVIAWLGEEDESTSVARSALDKWKSHDLRELQKAEQQAILELIDEPYWNRLWIAQEITSGPRVKIKCGSHSFHPHSLKAFCGVYNRRPDRLYHSRSKVYKLLCMINDTPEVHSKDRYTPSTPCRKNHPIEMLVDSLHDSHCANPRDKLYAILPMLSSSTRSLITVDYAKSIQEVFLDVVSLWPSEKIYHRHMDVWTISPLTDLLRSMLPNAFGDKATRKFRDLLRSAQLTICDPQHPQFLKPQPWFTTSVKWMMQEHFGWEISNVAKLDYASFEPSDANMDLDGFVDRRLPSDIASQQKADSLRLWDNI